MEKIIIFGVEMEPPSLKEKEEVAKRFEKQASIEMFNTVIDFMAKQNHWRFNNMRKYILNLAKIDRAIAIRLILKKAALMLDSKHEGHIKDAGDVFVVEEYYYNDVIPCSSNLYGVAPLFRTRGEALWALEAIKPLLKNEQED